ncbi:hypothetical protein BJ138DRAFT_1162737 [Hygrophoropsis aurantiaca]|uniref:Uncharacterized protein n=1 Tax=Hygrophoropsis aurantiaca TaxID=72124 RepID=A0ACB8A019_9AGAM|nr:hypothetical protein BJ138DRAFT_1162737 [Hygrophoropsis aurantiaca]
MLQNLPAEIQYIIIDQLPTASILELRLVSKYLKQIITHDRWLWAHVYRESSSLRQGGPFKWQTAKMLESNFIKSVNLRRNWPPVACPKPVHTHGPINFLGDVEFGLLCGKWLLSLEQHSKQILCYDLDRAAELVTDVPQVDPSPTLYECHEKDSKITQFCCASTFLNEGSADEDHPAAFLLVTEYDDVATLLKRTLFGVTFGDGSFPRLHMVLQIDHPAFPPASSTMSIGPRLLAISFRGKDVDAPAVLVDVETHQRYHFPESAVDTTKDVWAFTIITSSTHVLFFRRYKPPYEWGSQIHVQAYVVPPLQGTPHGSAVSASIELQLSHDELQTTDSSATFAPDLRTYTLLRDSQVQSSGQVHMTIVTVDFNQQQNIVVDFLCPKLIPAYQGIGSITLKTSHLHDNFLNHFGGENSGRIRIQPSLSGRTRAVAASYVGEMTRVAALFIDDTNSHRTAVSTQSYVPCFCDRKADSWYIAGFDAYYGRIITAERSPEGHVLAIDDFV